jgi:type I restriction enzyme M protein
MADNRKEVERAELHRTIWAIADELRVSVDRWDFKSYILSMLFYKYISENITAYINKGEWETGNKSFNYADLDDAIAEGARLKRSPLRWILGLIQRVASPSSIRSASP